jgi:Double zinc ribbon
MTSAKTRCPSCGRETAGSFCSHCGASLSGRVCGSCRAPMSPDAKFCAKCGAPAGGGTAAGGERRAWVIAAGVGGALLLGVLALVVRGGTGAPAAATPSPVAPFASGETGGTPPDLSTMTPRERFDRLYNRIMRASESGDQQTVTTFTPMALQAYEQLDTVDADARFHLATLKLHTGDVAGATAIGDTLLRENPNHLFGYVIAGTVARWQKNEKALAKAYADFLARYDKEIAANRPEYSDHKRMLDDFHEAAIAARKS